MKALNSSLQETVEAFDNVRDYLHTFEFTLGGNWEYDHGSFDRYLDEAHKVWLRIPFEVTEGTLDGDTDETDAMVKIGAPYVLKHVYNEGNDPEAHMMTVSALVNQFQTPLDPDAEIESEWIGKAEKLMRDVEQKWLH
ncbi:hypothetical protein PC41400_07225 [Paenibacillus chitinolyticus]|uniref:YugN-like family protein n=1 Tax=Paenibacillus chitinolyticus TaxID=79263 RepID=A0A410WSV4_9BACL|nr:YugN family protein [Paenibacillus chitinolyticus]MCY9588787.1 YugN-like family protein [Paenibacillus chitinolyticus]MCY9595709.1 YugN-like family protein [Paenibacillus chitinolyticus]QAV17465.1 hypothetical protein PC41400_07225 [Paenibacillus chitinolyticus]